MSSPAGTYRFVDLAPGARDAELLARFYETLYVAEFPDPDERESLMNMLGYLEHDGANGNAYVVTLLYDGEALAGGSICDYFVRSNCGAIEFLTVAPAARGRGLGSALAGHVQRRMAAAAEARGRSLAFVMAEMNDPFKRSRTPDNLDPFGRLCFWHQLGYRRTGFPYVQPALSPEQSPVRNLLLAALPVRDPAARSMEAAHVAAFLRDYLIYAMRFDDPRSSAEFRAMQSYLCARDTIPLGPFDAYIGASAESPLVVSPVEHANDPALAETMAVYRRAFGDSDLAVAEPVFASLLSRRRDAVRYHLWSLRPPEGGPVCGLASFFALPCAGFGGYVALEPPLLHTGRLATLIARIERTLIADAPAAQGWYIECAGDAVAACFMRSGFRPIALPYRQPPDGPSLTLLYKEFGASYEPAHLTAASFLAAQRAIVRAVYGLDSPDDAPSFVELARTVAALGAETITFAETAS